MEERNARMAPTNLVAMLLFVWMVGAGVGLILGPNLVVIGAAPSWTRGVFLACWVSSGLLLMMDKKGRISDLKPLGLSLLWLMLLMAFSGPRDSDAEGLGREISDVVRWLMIFGGLVLAPVLSLMVHVSEFYSRWKAASSGEQ